MNCIFCEIIENRADAEILYEDDYVMAFLDIRPFNLGHALVIPKIHIESFLDVDEIYLGKMIKVVQKVSAACQKALKADGFNILSNNGASAGQTIYHCHFHIIPRFKTDGFKFKMNLKEYEEGEMKEYADSIKKIL